MKPRIILIFGIWHCGDFTGGHYGLGFTPKEAFDDWEAKA